MDPIDLQIIRGLTWNPLDPADHRRGVLGPWDVARALDVHGTTVKRRLEALVETGALEGFFLLPHPSVLGVAWGHYRLVFDQVATRNRASSRLQHHTMTTDGHGVPAHITFVGPELWIQATAPIDDDLEAHVSRVASDVGALATERLHVTRGGLDPSLVSALDRRILRAKMTDPFLSASRVAEVVGVTAKTVQTRLKRLEDLAAFSIVAGIRPDRLDGAIAFALVAHGADATRRTAFVNAFDEAFSRASVGADRPFVMLTAPSSTEVDACLARAEASAGAGSVSLHIMQSEVCNLHPREGMDPIGELLQAPAALASPR